MGETEAGALPGGYEPPVNRWNIRQRYAALTSSQRNIVIHSVIAGVLTLTAFFFAVCDVLRAVVPGFLVSISEPLYFAPYMVITLIAGDLALFVSLMGIQTSLDARSRFRGNLAALIVTIVAIVASVTGGVLAQAYPEGVISSDSSYRAPVQQPDVMEREVEAAAGVCDSGWASLETSTYHGTEYVASCQTNHTAIIVFENEADASLGMKRIQNSALKHIYGTNGDASDKKAQAEGFSALNGARWSIIGPTGAIYTLEQQWDGDVVDLKTKLHTMLG
ncbi:MAG: hypothetical protein LKI93_02265 [Bifidobacteriaceae bacterium]|jgi:hypothetical protein|nr:hypothetical protein [Bifidobacteriaceae bacterium]MCI1914327.1 hypothetical protein [Bifidobacteriaceae bacterium]